MWPYIGWRWKQFRLLFLFFIEVFTGPRRFENPRSDQRTERVRVQNCTREDPIDFKHYLFCAFNNILLFKNKCIWNNYMTMLLSPFFVLCQSALLCKWPNSPGYWCVQQWRTVHINALCKTQSIQEDECWDLLNININTNFFFVIWGAT